ncbi:MAG: putative toxin-antitoxin system toxin component, PIN family [Bacteroidota bacterium]
MKVLIDTNVFLVSIPKKSSARPIFDALLKGKFQLIISNDILLEYVEVITEKTNSAVANNISDLLLKSRYVTKADVYFKWNLIEADKDDNKFVDCAISGRADFLVSNDKHFNVLKHASLSFPGFEVVSSNDFLKLLEQLAR